jgi:hypothetical protein
MFQNISVSMMNGQSRQFSRDNPYKHPSTFDNLAKNWLLTSESTILFDNFGLVRYGKVLRVKFEWYFLIFHVRVYVWLEKCYHNKKPQFITKKKYFFKPCKVIFSASWTLGINLFAELLSKHSERLTDDSYRRYLYHRHIQVDVFLCCRLCRLFVGLLVVR